MGCAVCEGESDALAWAQPELVQSGGSPLDARMQGGPVEGLIYVAQREGGGSITSMTVDSHQPVASPSQKLSPNRGRPGRRPPPQTTLEHDPGNGHEVWQ
jgi:hypothetical protein